jgi:peptide/nickel transport system ATP-binding protein
VSTSRPVLELDDVSVHFREESMLTDIVPDSVKRRFGFEDGKETVHAVDNVSIDINDNDVVALVGESGCGKTTLGKAAVALQRPTSGSVRYKGHDIWDLYDGNVEADMGFEEIRRALQVIHQDPGSALNPNRTVQANLSSPMERWNPELTFRERRDRVLRLLKRIGLTPADDYADRYTHQLSGGEQQRVALIRALMLEPDVILADEAVSALDVSLRIEIMDLMLDLQESFDTSYVFVSHNLSNARYLAGQADGSIAVMYLGRIVEYGPAEDIISNPQHPYTKILKWATPVLDPEQAAESMRADTPMRGIDIPDATNPPSGCRFHTRCPEAREACTRALPEFYPTSEPQSHVAACYRLDDDHEYWNSPKLGDEAAEGYRSISD